jgi:hypothetical protein
MVLDALDRVLGRALGPYSWPNRLFADDCAGQDRPAAMAPDSVVIVPVTLAI